MKSVVVVVSLSLLQIVAVIMLLIVVGQASVLSKHMVIAGVQQKHLLRNDARISLKNQVRQARSIDTNTNLPLDSIKISSLHIISSTTARFTDTSVTSQLVNTGDESKEAELIMELPEEAFITELYIEVNGTIYRSKVEEKEEAQEIYNTAKACGRTTSLVQQRSERSFAVSINVEAQSEVKCTLIYQQLLLRKKGFYENRISIRPNQTVADLRVDAYIIEPEGLTQVKAWLETTEKDGEIITTDLANNNIDLASSQRAHVRFQPTENEQATQSQQGIIGDFVIKYDVVHEFNGGNIQVVNGYFVHHFSPEGIAPVAKQVVFVIDVSGSMIGTKLDQTRVAMLTILDQLQEGDTFNIVLFHTTVSVWKKGTMVTVSTDMITTAKSFIRGLEAKDSTNFYGGIESAVTLLNQFHSSNNNQYVDTTLSMIIILSDGQPSAGVTATDEIVKLTKEIINNQYSLFTLGFGNDVDGAFLEKLAGQNRGIYRKIYVDSDSSLQLASFFDDISTPLLINVEFHFPSDIVNIESITQMSFPSYFEGTELVVAGQLAEGQNEVSVNVIGGSGDRGVIDVTAIGSVVLSENIVLNTEAVEDFTQRLWAYLTIKELLRKQIIVDDKDEKERLEARALELSLKYHFVTPLTSLVVVKPPDINGNVDNSNSTQGECDPEDYDVFLRSYGGSGDSTRSSMPMVLLFTGCSLLGMVLQW
ncbi:inter-alpha-trypsin inhibitor heavy chain H4-like [Amphiura filiformis]|uniref:inter-alpha-trypsin inhibitor heavy chain H4-like n=1 Tax=Amphiura filiformis TaxID=82378 RepID=UPI003B22428F